MLKSIELINFQKHKRKKIEFDPKVTTIVGETESGKSSIIRMLYWLCLNQAPRGQFIRFGKKSTTGILKVNKHTITRKRGKGSNIYRLDGKVYKSFGTIPPEDISNILNMGEANFQRQLDLHFWFSDTAGQVSRSLNEIVNLQIIDSTLANISSELRRADAAVDAHKEQLLKAKEAKRELSWVPEFVKEGMEVIAEEARYQENALAARSLGFLLQNAATLANTRRRAGAAVQNGKNAIEAGERALHYARRAELLGAHISLARDHKALLESPVPSITELAREREKADAVAERRRQLESLIHEIILGENECRRQHSKLRENAALLEQMSKKRKRCSKCKQFLPVKTSLQRA